MQRMIVGIDSVDPQNLDEALKKAYNEVHSWRTTANIETWTHTMTRECRAHEQQSIGKKSSGLARISVAKTTGIKIRRREARTQETRART